MNIKTHFVYPPIPVRCCDWSAVDDDTYDGDGPVGWGATEAEAIEDLLEQMEPDPDRLREDRDERRRLEKEP
jgi:hypothetical protein